MPRRQRDLDPSGGPTTELARELRGLRARAGDPKFETMARRTGRSKTALAEAAGGRRLPRWETVEDFVRACDGDPATWRDRWETARAGTSRTAGTSPTGSTAPPGPVGPVESPRPPDQPEPPPPTEPRAPRAADEVGRRRLPWVAAGATAAVVLAAGAGFVVGRESASPYAPIGPMLRAVEVQNMVALGADRLVEDRSPAYLSTVPLAYCAQPSRGCKVPGTEMGSGVAVVANCVTAGQRMWNYDLGDPSSRDNRDRADSDRWYRMSFPDGRSGYLAEVYVTPASRGGLGLPGCGPVGVG